MLIATVSAVVFGLLLGSAQADKDDSYYIAGTGNPNKNEKMYWKDAENIFQDLSQFSALYVEFHNCAWTWMQTSEEDNDIDENDYWYLGKIPPMGANVAYSLYGSLKGSSFSGCNADSFINSFYTNSGFTDFTKAMKYAGLSGFSSSSSYSATCGGGYGVGCDYSNGFAVHTYSGSECNPSDYTGVKDKLSNLNSAMDSAKCIQIYDSNSYSGSPYNTALELLSYSHSCFYQDFFSPDGVCPDPYGKLSYYQEQFYNGIQESKNQQDPYQINERKKEYTQEIEQGKIMSAAGIGLAALAFFIGLYEFILACCCRPRRKVLPPRSQDIILTKRSKEDLESAGGTEEEKSDCPEDYVTMSYESGTDLEASRTNYAPPADAPYTPPADAAPATPSAKANIAPTVIPPPHPGNKIQVNTMDQEEPVTLYAPPCVASDELEPKKKIIVDVKETEAAPIILPPSAMESLVKKDKEPTEQEAEKEQVEESTEPKEASGEQLEKTEETTDAPTTIEPPITEAPEAPESFLTAKEPSEAAAEESIAAPEATSPEEPSAEDTLSVSADHTSSSASLSTVEVANTEAVLPEELPDAEKLVASNSFSPLFAGIRGSSSELAPADGSSASIPCIDEIVASREFDSDSETDEATDDTAGETQPRAPDSQYFDAAEMAGASEDKDEIEQGREEEEAQPEVAAEGEKEDVATDDAATDDSATDDAATEDAQGTEEGDEDIPQSDSWLSSCGL